MTEWDLREAVRRVMMNNRAVEAMFESLPLPAVLEYAAKNAFMHDMRGPAVELVREALLMLASPGFFTFEEEDE